jgi:hypothetical protein
MDGGGGLTSRDKESFVSIPLKMCRDVCSIYFFSWMISTPKFSFHFYTKQRKLKPRIMFKLFVPLHLYLRLVKIAFAGKQNVIAYYENILESPWTH